MALCGLRQVVVVVGVVVVISATIGGAWDAASRRLLHRESDLQRRIGDCMGPSSDVSTRHDKFELTSPRPDGSVQLHIRCNLPVSYQHDTRAT